MSFKVKSKEFNVLMLKNEKPFIELVLTTFDFSGKFLSNGVISMGVCERRAFCQGGGRREEGDRRRKEGVHQTREVVFGLPRVGCEKDEKN
jgi:hypothetical protein